jgi:hypothetical protein
MPDVKKAAIIVKGGRQDFAGVPQTQFIGKKKSPNKGDK